MWRVAGGEGDGAKAEGRGHKRCDKRSGLLRPTKHTDQTKTISGNSRFSSTNYQIWIVNCEPTSKSRIMRLNKNIGMILLAIYLIIDGLLGFGVNFGPAIFLLYLVALAAGVCILIGK